MWKNIVERGRPQMAIWRMRIACWVPKATDTHSEYVTLTAVPLQHLLHERASLIRYKYVGSIVSVFSVRWELILNIMQMMCSVQMIKFSCASQDSNRYLLTDTAPVFDTMLFHGTLLRPYCGHDWYSLDWDFVITVCSYTLCLHLLLVSGLLLYVPVHLIDT